MIDAMYQAGTDAALDDQLRRVRPSGPPAGPGFSFSQLAKAPFQGIGSGAAKSIAFGAEVLGAFGDVAGALPGIADTPEQRRQQDESRQKLLTGGPSYSNEAGDTFRRRSADIMPDAATTHASAQVVAGMSEFMAQALGYTLAGGPVVGPTLLAGDVGLAEADKLKREGVDLKTRAQAGAVAGAVAGVSTVIPMHGASALSRFAKGAAAGEAGIVGQTAAERLILQHGGYDKIAETYDPLDPVALGVGLIPGVLGAALGRPTIKAPKPMPAPRTEAELRTAVALTPAEQARSAAYEASDANLAELRAAVAAEKNPSNRATLQAELDKQTAAAAEMRTRAAVEQQPDLIRSARVLQAAEALESSRLTPDSDLAGRDAHVRAVEMAGDQLAAGQAVRVADVVEVRPLESLPQFIERTGIRPEPVPAEVPGRFVGWLRDQGGITLAEKFDITGERGGVRSNPGGIFSKAGRGLDELAAAAERDGYLPPGTVASDTDPGGARAMAELIRRGAQGERVLTMGEQVQAAQRAQVLDGQAQRMAEVERRLQVLGVDTSPAAGNVAALEAYAHSNGPRLLDAALWEMNNAGRAETAQAVPPHETRVPSRGQSAIDTARQAGEDMRDSSKTLQQFLADSPQPPEVQNLLVGMERAKDDAARARMLDEFDRVSRADTATPLHDLAADVVDRMGSEKAAPEASALDRAAADVAALNPDMMVELEGREPMRVADLLEAVKREAAEDAADARLIEVAAQCALRH